MKSFRYTLLLTAILASGPMLARAAAPGTRPSFVPAQQAGHISMAPGHAAAVRALRNFASAMDTAPTSGNSRRHTARSLSGQLTLPGRHLPGSSTPSDQAPPPGFPLALQDMDNLKQLRIGWGFAVYDVHPDELLHGHNLQAEAQPTGQWRYAVLLHGKPVGMVTMVQTGHGWQAVSFGGAPLSKHINRLVAKYGHQQGVQIRYIRVPQATSDFIEIKHPAERASYVPLTAARTSLHLETATPRSGAALLPALREAVRHNLATHH